jgi:dUTP pyrophosphatase
MKEIDATEQAYVNGFSSGYEAGRRSVGIPTRIKAVVDVGCAIPIRAHETDAGLDLYATKSGWILPKCRKVFGTGFHCAIPKNYVGMLTSKSGLMLKGITSRGTIDCGYTGEVKAVLFNHSWRFVRIKKGQKISQMVLMPIITPKLDLVDSLDKTDRGTGGFGSTGL